MYIRTITCIAARMKLLMIKLAPTFFIGRLATFGMRACLLLSLNSTPLIAVAKLPTATQSMSPEIKLVEDYNTWFGGTACDPAKVKAGLPNYITNDTVLHEVASLPWGGTMVGYAGWARLCQVSRPIYEPITAVLDITGATYYQHKNLVIREITLTFKPTKEAPNAFVMGLIEKYTIQKGRISSIDEFYADTASFLSRLRALGVLPDNK